LVKLDAIPRWDAGARYRFVFPDARGRQREHLMGKDRGEVRVSRESLEAYRRPCLRQRRKALPGGRLLA